MSGRRPDAQLVAALAARGSGKSAWLAQWLKANPSPRRVIWDTKREHGLDGTTDLGEAIRRMMGARWCFAFYPDLSDAKRLAGQFDLFCRAVYAAKHCQAIIEELAFVTKPSAAPPGWRQLLILGRDENPKGGNVSVVCTAQRPASVDKDLLANCTLIHAGRLPYEADAVLVGRALGVPASELQTLPKLAWIERGEGDDGPRRGVLRFKGAPAQVVKKTTKPNKPNREPLGPAPEAQKVMEGE